MRRALLWGGVAAVVAASLGLGLRPAGQPSSLPARADRLAAGLRCPVCQGLSVRDSDSPTARSIRDDIRRRLQSGQRDGEVRAAYVARYGQWVLLRPRTSGLEGLVWALPAAALGAGAVGLGWGFGHWRRRGGRREPSDEERRLVEQTLGRPLGGAGGAGVG